MDHIADGVTASTSPGAATPSLKNEPGELADEGEPEWSVENRVEPGVGAFHGTAEFTNSLEQPVSERLAKDAEIQAFKEREPEHARFRDVAQYPLDVEIEAVIQAMLYAACEELPTF